jgi:hypothetical protein
MPSKVRSEMSGQVIDRVDLADGAGSIVLYDWMAEEVKDGRNLARVDAGGNVLWKARQPKACRTASLACSGMADR